MKRRIRRTGADVAGVILEEFPEAEIVVLPEGAYVAAIGTPDHPYYDLWVEFYRGLEGRKPPKGIHIFASGSIIYPQSRCGCTGWRGGYGAMCWAYPMTLSISRSSGTGTTNRYCHPGSMDCRPFGPPRWFPVSPQRTALHS